MTPKEKAKELVDRFKNDTVIYTWDNNGYEIDKETSLQNAKNCALICVDEKIKTASKGVLPSEFPTKEVLRLREVKQEIIKL